MITDFLAAIGSKQPFPLAWKRARHLRCGHPFDKSERLEKLRSQHHPHNYEGYVYTINIMRCHDCGLTWLDVGMEYNKRTDGESDE